MKSLREAFCGATTSAEAERRLQSIVNYEQLVSWPELISIVTALERISTLVKKFNFRLALIGGAHLDPRPLSKELWNRLVIYRMYHQVVSFHVSGQRRELELYVEKFRKPIVTNFSGSRLEKALIRALEATGNPSFIEIAELVASSEISRCESILLDRLSNGAERNFSFDFHPEILGSGWNQLTEFIAVYHLFPVEFRAEMELYSFYILSTKLFESPPDEADAADMSIEQMLSFPKPVRPPTVELPKPRTKVDLSGLRAIKTQKDQDENQVRERENLPDRKGDEPQI